MRVGDSVLAHSISVCGFKNPSFKKWSCWQEENDAILFFFIDSSSVILSHGFGYFSADTFLQTQVLHVWYSMKLSELWLAASCLNPVYLKSSGGEEGGCPIRNWVVKARGLVWCTSCLLVVTGWGGGSSWEQLWLLLGLHWLICEPMTAEGKVPVAWSQYRQIFPAAFFPEDAVICKFLKNPPWFQSVTSRWPWCSNFWVKVSVFNCWL